jgi:ornithine cyclodeaminase/alanine dehydrogenase-like protein (mu-crystallin family)
MTGPVLRLRHGEMVRALKAIDLLDLLAEELVRPLTGAPEASGTSRFVPETSGPVTSTELTAVRDVQTGRVCLLPTPSLHMICLAGLAGLAARELLPPGVVTAAVFGSGATAQLHLQVIARHVPNVSHAAIYPPPAELASPTELSLRDQFALSGIELSIKNSPRSAARGANLLVVAELGWDRLDIGRPRPGTLVINASRRDLPDTLLADIDLIYVDDLSLLQHNQHRKFVRAHLFGPGAHLDATPPRREGWHRRQLWRDQQRIASDLGQVVIGWQMRMNVDDIVLVELFGEPSFDIVLARRICQSAIRLGLGT